jgi:hypothetical protein
MRGLHRLQEKILASQEHLCFMEIFSRTDHDLAIQKTYFRREERRHGFPEAMLLFYVTFRYCYDACGSDSFTELFLCCHGYHSNLAISKMVDSTAMVGVLLDSGRSHT